MFIEYFFEKVAACSFCHAIFNQQKGTDGKFAVRTLLFCADLYNFKKTFYFFRIYS